MDAVIFDMDGTLCDVAAVRHYVNGDVRDFDKFHSASLFCFPRPEVLGLFRAVRSDLAKVIVTARESRFDRVTRNWLYKYDLAYDSLYMRPWGDYRPDVVVKRDILDDIREDGYNVVFAVDDNPAIVQLWRDQGIPCLDVGWNDG